MSRLHLALTTELGALRDLASGLMGCYARWTNPLYPDESRQIGRQALTDQLKQLIERASTAFALIEEKSGAKNE